MTESCFQETNNLTGESRLKELFREEEVTGSGVGSPNGWSSCQVTAVGASGKTTPGERGRSS